jgi:hypothetical protein
VSSPGLPPLASTHACLCMCKEGDTAGFECVDCSARQGIRGRCMLPASGCLYYDSTCGEKPVKTLHACCWFGRPNCPAHPSFPTLDSNPCQHTLPPTLWLVASHVCVNSHYFAFPLAPHVSSETLQPGIQASSKTAPAAPATHAGANRTQPTLLKAPHPLLYCCCCFCCCYCCCCRGWQCL